MRSVFRTFPRLLTAALIFALTPALALAYVGPGAGISMLGALWGLIVGVLMALGVILFWPIRMLIRKMKANKVSTEEAAGTADDAAGSGSKQADNSTSS
jgi:type VI protein secretion system component VasK